MDFRKKRWLCLFAGLGLEAFSGVGYVWSIFQAPLIEKYGWSVTQVAITYTLSSVSCMLCTIFFGAKVHRLMSIRKELVMGILLYCVFIMATAFIGGHLILLYLFFGVLSSFGLAFLYPLLIAYAVDLFPDRSGFAGGMMTAGYGLGGVLLAPLVIKLYTVTGDISKVFLILGGLFLVGMLLLSLLIVSPPPEFRREMLEHRAERAKHHSYFSLPDTLYEVDTPTMLRLPLFYTTFLMLLLSLACGVMIINQASPIMVHTFGSTPSAAAAIVSILAVANVAGRLLWGTLSDRAGKSVTMVLIITLLLLSTSGLLLFSAKTLFVAALLCVVFCYGGVASLIAPLTGELFGNFHVNENYSVMFCAIGCSSLVGPPLISAIRDLTGTYTIAYFCAVGFSLVALVMSGILLYAERKAAR